MATIEKMSQKELIAKIRELESTPSEMVETDEGTHGKPANHYIYETIAGVRFATRKFAGGDETRISETEANERTDGRMRTLSGNQDRIREAQADLKAARNLLAKLER